MTKIYQNAEIIKLSYASALNTQSQEITRKKIQLVNMQHLYFDSNLVRFQYISDEAEKLEKEIKELENELVINWAKALTICKGIKGGNDE